MKPSIKGLLNNIKSYSYYMEIKSNIDKCAKEKDEKLLFFLGFLKGKPRFCRVFLLLYELDC